MDEPTTVGQRIAYWRKRRGLTQQVLAGLAGISASYLAKVEQGKRILDRLSILLALANVLKIEPSQLIGGVPLPANGGAPTDPPQGIPAVRRAVLLDPPADREAPEAAALQAEVAAAKRLRQAGQLEALSQLLPGLLDAGHAAVTREVPGAWSSLAHAQQTASSLARALGDVDLAWIAADRAVTSAQRSGDPLLEAQAKRRLANALMRHGWLDEAGALCSNATDRIAPTDATPLEGWSLWGSLHLTESVAAVRRGDATGAWRLLRDAETAADRVGPGRNDYWEAFGPPNVGAIEVAVALESGDPVEALRLADTVEIEELPSAERRARFCISVAQAHVLRRDDAATVALLLEAERHASEVLRHSVLARELVRVCLRRERRSRTPGLRRLAERSGALD